MYCYHKFLVGNHPPVFLQAVLAIHENESVNAALEVSLILMNSRLGHCRRSRARPRETRKRVRLAAATINKDP